jgi:hypothetical protein
MATITGVGGKVSAAGNTIAEISSFSFDEGFDEGANPIASHNLNDPAEKNKPGRTNWSATIECMWDKADTTGQGAMTIGASLQIVFKPEGETTGDQIYTGTAVITGRSQAVADEAMVTQSFNLQGDGALVPGSHL